MEECNYTQNEVAEHVGKNRSTVTNTIRLLQLPAYIQAALRDDDITSGHARALINLKNEALQEKLLKKIIKEQLSVRQVEEIARDADKKNEQQAKKSSVKKSDPFIEDITGRLRRTLSTKVAIKPKGDGGEIRIEYYSQDELERLLHLFEDLR
jgi:ParB family chromosome partitioning protein